MDKLDALYSISKGFNNRFGDINPFRMITNILEEAGELAGEINHFENTGVKQEKHGIPNQKKNC